jgi:16S rRNA (adenine1518-N6/adenine1519-N6)-dimethyltransferase
VKHIPRKRFGQHFLTDQGIIGAIVDGIDPQPGDAMVEIGPGLAALTQPLVERLGTLTVIELDRDLAAQLRKHPQLEVIQSDVLKVNFKELLANVIVKRSLSAAKNIALDATSSIASTRSTHPTGETGAIAPAPPLRKLRIVGNLPYNISTPILFHLLDVAALVQDQHFMLQKEVIDRMVAQPSTGDYGRLSVMLQWRYAMANTLFVPPTSFDPPPRVDSAIVRMIPHETPAPVNFELLEELVKVAFSQRRKMLRNTLGRWLDERGYAGTFDVARRAEEVPSAEFVALAQGVGAAGA